METAHCGAAKTRAELHLTISVPVGIAARRSDRKQYRIQTASGDRARLMQAAVKIDDRRIQVPETGIVTKLISQGPIRGDVVQSKDIPRHHIAVVTSENGRDLSQAERSQKWWQGTT